MKIPLRTLLAASLFTLGLHAELHAQAAVIDLPTNQDVNRQRNVPLTFHLPKQTSARPLVLISHGGAGSRHGMYAIAAELAKQGYVALCLEHVTSNTDNIRQRMRNKGLGFKAALLDSGKDMIPRKNRPLDVKFAIDLATQLNTSDPRFKGRMDLTQIAIIGHSYGAYTAMVSCGVKPVGLAENLADPRIVLGIGLSPQSANGEFFNQDSFKKVTRPFVGISGTRDIAGQGHRDFFQLMPKGDKHLIWFYDANHFSFSDPTGGPRRLPRVDADVTRALKVLLPGILDHYLLEQSSLDQKTRQQLIGKSIGGTVRRIDWQAN
ncbi:hypothetical protein JIN77_09715 [Verrucomicrobiaceae bacterium R5-34]|nr:hypothetical protein [Verrucomicrobiaceae bacterium R5-34]